MNKTFLVRIVPNQAAMIEKHVVARNEKAALLAVIESLPETHPAWGAAGWRDVESYEASRPFIL